MSDLTHAQADKKSLNFSQLSPLMHKNKNDAEQPRPDLSIDLNRSFTQPQPAAWPLLNKLNAPLIMINPSTPL